jgi:hypothetical protein
MQGGSMLAFHGLLQNFNYKIIGVQGAALFAAPSDLSPTWAQLSVQDTWNQYVKGPTKWFDTDKELMLQSKDNKVQELSIGLQNFVGQFEMF